MVRSAMTMLCPIRTQPPWNVLFLGTDRFALTILQALHADLVQGCLATRTSAVVNQLEVVTKPLKCPVSEFASLNSAALRHHIWPDIDIRRGQFDVGVIASFGHLIPEKFINLFPYGILNVHPSLLPKWRGAAPILHTILNGDITTGVSIQQIRPRRFDIGPILARSKRSVPDGSTSLGLSATLATDGAKLLLEALADLPRLEALEVEQDERAASYAPKILADDPRLTVDWSTETCVQIDRKFRALGEVYDIKSFFGDQRVKLRNILPTSAMWWYTLRDSHMASKPGSVVYSRSLGCLCIQCADGLVGIKDIVIRKPMSAHAFHNGYLTKEKWKGVRFANVPRPLVDCKTDDLRVTTRQEMYVRTKNWQAQLLRLASSRPD